METITYTCTGIFFEIIEKGLDFQVRIAEGWQDTTGKNNDRIILTFDQHFSCRDHARAFTTTPLFKSILKATVKSFIKKH